MHSGGYQNDDQQKHKKGGRGNYSLQQFQQGPPQLGQASKTRRRQVVVGRVAKLVVGRVVHTVGREITTTDLVSYPHPLSHAGNHSKLVIKLLYPISHGIPDSGMLIQNPTTCTVPVALNIYSGWIEYEIQLLQHQSSHVP